MIGTGSGLATVVAGGLIAAAAVGWVMHWLWSRLTGAPRTDAARIDDLVARLDRAETAREAAEAALAESETRHAARESELMREIEELRARLAEVDARKEAELAHARREAEADARTAWEGLRGARARIGELERELAALRERG